MSRLESTQWKKTHLVMASRINPKKQGETTTGTTITADLFFSGNCEEALEFYRNALGAEGEMLMRVEHCALRSIRPKQVRNPARAFPPRNAGL
jgi:hypothetical protein